MRRTASFAIAAGLAGGVFVSGAGAQTQSDFVARMDTDGDHRVCLPEYIDYMSYAFRRMDRNGDGVLAPDEQLVPNGKRLTIAEHEANLTAMFKRQDIDHDGYLSARELAAPPR
jgi:Ca2+-binding EF-hand superfamily protein